MHVVRPPPPRLLFLDGDEMSRRAFARCLGMKGFDTEAAGSVAEALGRLEDERFDVVAADLTLPGGGGLFLAARLATTHPNLPVVLVSADTEFRLAGEIALTRSIVGIVFKPWDVEEVVEVLRRALRGSIAPVTLANPLGRAQGAHTRKTPLGLTSPLEGTALLICDSIETATELRSAFTGIGHRPEQLRLLPTLREVEDSGHKDIAVALIDITHAASPADEIVELQRKLRRTVPVIAVSRYVDDALAEQVLRAGAQDLLPSHVSAYELKRTLRFARERHHADARAAFLTEHDPVTGLFNRASFDQQLARSVAAARRDDREIAVVILQVAGLSNYQRRFGYEGVGLLTRRVGNALSALGQRLETVARIGTAQFAWVVEQRGELMELTELALARVHSTLAASPVELKPQIGIAVYPENGTRAGELTRNATFALTQAKFGQLDYRFYSQDLHDREERRWSMEQVLRRALDRNEFSLVFQPQFDLTTSEPRAFEALLRWNNPDLGRVSPAEFIPVLEESGMILRVGTWVIDEAARAAKHLQSTHGPEVRVAVNLSPAQFRDPNLVANIQVALDREKLAAQCLEIELTEGMLIEDTDAASATLLRLKEIGVDLAVDDFGTGYSSLSYLKHFPIDVLKIDRVFVKDAGDQQASSRLLRGIVALGHGLGLRVVAEGVETEAELAILRDSGCDLVQGYLLGRPLPLDDHTQGQPLKLVAT